MSHQIVITKKLRVERKYKMEIEFNNLVGQFKLAMLLLLLFTICVASLNYNKESKQDSSLNSNISTISSLPCFERYAMEQFFRRHDNVIDLSVQDYIKHKAASSLDITASRLLVLERHLIGEGYHRLLSSSIRFSVSPNLSPDFSAQMCEVIIIESLPSGVFADPFELDHILQHGVFKDASVFGDVNLELPSSLSNRSVVEIHLDAALNISAEKDIVMEFKVQIPLHARYPSLVEGGYSTIRFSVPDLFLRYKIHEDSPTQTCLITPIAGNDRLKVNEVHWSIPAGMEAHSRLVSAVTFTAALFSAIMIIAASFKYTCGV